MRRRILANAWARSAEISGPASTTGDPLFMSDDTFRENGPNVCPYTFMSCTPTTPAERDRLEVYWAWDYTTPEDQVFNDDLNRAVGPRDTLLIPAAGMNSMLFPGAHLRFVSGPAVSYPTGARWTPMAPAPSGEGPVRQASLEEEEVMSG